jgi:hypothetical protein
MPSISAQYRTLVLLLVIDVSILLDYYWVFCIGEHILFLSINDLVNKLATVYRGDYSGVKPLATVYNELMMIWSAVVCVNVVFVQYLNI